jgi:5-(carboxyamino)imidazole ribonucleotide synthase
MHFGKKIGIIGGGQLGKMMMVPANLLGFKTACYSNEEGSPATIFAHEVEIGSYEDEEKILNFASKCDFLTIEFESIKYSILEKINKTLYPNSQSIFITQNRFREKTLANKLEIKTASFSLIKNKEEALEFFNKYGKFLLKTTENGYDGKGQFLISKPEDINQNIPFNIELIAESFIDFAFEASVILTRFYNGEIATFPVPTNIHKSGILHKSIIHEIEAPWKEKVTALARNIANELQFIGTMAVEFFITTKGDILFNEMAPRPHNSGHFTLDLCNICQFESHIRAITNLPLIKPKLLFEGEMLNLVGSEVNSVTKYLDISNAKLHIYGKKSVKEKRKIGHINIIYNESFS